MGAALVDEAKFKASLQGGDVLSIPARTAWTQAFALTPGATLRWQFRCNAKDVGFALRRRAMAHGGAVEVDIVESRRFPAGVAVAGDWMARAPCTVVCAFDNT